MAYCLRSLLETLEQLLYPHKHYKNWVLDHDHRSQIKSFLENTYFLTDFLDNSSPQIQEHIASLENQIMEAAEKAENTLQTRIISYPVGPSSTIIPPDLEKEFRVFELAKEEAIKIMSDAPWYRKVSTTHYPDSENVVVGMEEDLMLLRSRITSSETKLDIIPIVGTGGIGKTTLARTLYDQYSSTKSHFHYCVWVTISQTYNLRQILQTLLGETAVNSLNKRHNKQDKDLIVSLHRKLARKRYLIVLDDIWSHMAWDDMQKAFPRDRTGSRILVTTRERHLADCVGYSCLEMHLLNDHHSWELMRKKVFGVESCPHELEQVGKKIATSCGGLPLALQLIGGHLSETERSPDYWEYVVYNVASLIAKSNDISAVFSWSYDNLPIYLKPCFLYTGVFPEDHVIRASRIIKLWIAEGFVRPVQGKSLEETASMHLNALVNRNLLFVREKKSNGKAKSYGVHDILRDMCLTKAQEKSFLYVKDSQSDNQQKADMFCLRRVSDYSTHIYDEHLPSLKLTSYLRSLVIIYPGETKLLSSFCFMLSLLRVLDLLEVYFYEFPDVILKLINLRYLAIQNSSRSLPESISILRNLQTLISSGMRSLAVLVDMPQLRHLKFSCLYQTFHEISLSLHENLQSLSNVSVAVLKELLGKLPNLRKLEIDGSGYHHVDLTCFHNLETFKCSYGFFIKNGTSISKIIFPNSLKKLSLYSCGLPESLLEAIGMLPNLQILKFVVCLHVNPDWGPCDNGFLELQYLLIERCTKLENWVATKYSFPALRHLVLQNCGYLNEIPDAIGTSLEIVEVDECKASVFDSAKRIKEEQLKFGNDGLQLWLGSELKEEEVVVEELEILNFGLDECKASVFDSAKRIKEEQLKLGNDGLQLRLGSELREQKVVVEELDILNCKNEKHELTLEHYIFRSKTVFPHFLNKLTLKFCKVSQSLLSAIGILPELQFFKLKHCNLESSTWEPSEGEFFRLQYLKLAGLNLENLLATKIHFPVLCHLVLKYCADLNEIPNDIERIETLKSIEVDYCKTSVFDSAKRISEKRLQEGNTHFLLVLGRVYDINQQLKKEDEAFVAATQLSCQNISDRSLPDKAIDLVDEAGSMVRLRPAQLPDEARELEKELRQLTAKKNEPVRGQIPKIDLVSPADSLISPVKFGIKTRTSQVLSPFVSSSPAKELNRQLSLKEMELSEDFTCVVVHGPNPKTANIFDDWFVDYDDKHMKMNSEPSSVQQSAVDFLNVCHNCKNKLEGRDIYIYRGEMSFCSPECRGQEMLEIKMSRGRIGADSSVSVLAPRLTRVDRSITDCGLDWVDPSQII